MRHFTVRKRILIFPYYYVVNTAAGISNPLLFFSKGMR